MDHLIQLCLCPQHDGHSGRIVIGILIQSFNIRIVRDMVAARQYQRFQFTHIVLVLCGDIPAAKIKYVDVFSLVHIRKVAPVRCDKTGQLVCFLLDMIATALIDKLRALNADFHNTIGCLVVGNIHEGGQLIQRLVSRIAQGHGCLDAARLYFHDLKVEILDGIAELVDLIDIVADLRIDVVLVTL